MRIPSTTDLKVDVEGIGTFQFARRTMRDAFRIRGEYMALTSGNVDANGNMADLGALAFVTLSELLVAQPSGVDVLAADPNVDDKAEDKIVLVFMKLREKEASFRPKPASESEEGGEGSGAHV